MKRSKAPDWQDLLSQNYKIDSVREGMIGYNKKLCSRKFTKKSCLSVSQSEHKIKNKFVIIGVPDDRGVALNLGHTGSKEGPAEFRNCFYKLYDTKIQGTYLGDSFVDIGDIKIEKSIEKTHENLALVVKEVLNCDAEMIFVIGGGHDFSYGSYKGHALWAKGKIVPIFNFDAHLDVRPVEKNEINSGTAFWRIVKDLASSIGQGKALIELGIQRSRNPEKLYDFCAKQNISIVEYEPFLAVMKNLLTGHTQKIVEHIRDHFDLCVDLGFDREHGSAHVSFCLDVLSQFIAPGTSASTPFGLNFSELIPAFSFFANKKNCRVLDIAELCPKRDLNFQTTRLTAAFVYHFAKMRQELLCSSLTT